MNCNRSVSSFRILLIIVINTFTLLLCYQAALGRSKLHVFTDTLPKKRNLRSSKTNLKLSTKKEQLETADDFYVGPQPRSMSIVNVTSEKLLLDTATYLHEHVDNGAYPLDPQLTNMTGGYSSHYLAELTDNTSSASLESTKNYSKIEGNIMQHDYAASSEANRTSSILQEFTLNNSNSMQYVNAISAEASNTSSILLESSNNISTIEGNLMQHDGDTISDKSNIFDTVESTYTTHARDIAAYRIPLEIRIFLEIKLGDAFIPNEQESTLDNCSALFADLLVSALHNTTKVYFIDAELPSTHRMIDTGERPVAIYDTKTPLDITKVIQSSCDDSTDDSCFIVKASIHLLTGPYVDNKMVKNSVIMALSHVLSNTYEHQ